MNIRRHRELYRWNFAWLVFIALLLIPLTGLCQDVQVRSWHVENGLPDGTVTALAQTPDGYLWAGTRKGLVRFDGVSFSPITGRDGRGLQDGRVVDLAVDREGALWIASESGIITVFSKGELRTRYIPRSARAKVAEASATNDNAGQIFRSDQGTWHTFNRLAVDGEGAVWALIVEENLVLRFTGAAEPATIATDGLSPGALDWVISDSKGEIWLRKGIGVSVFRAGQWQPDSADNSIATWANVCASHQSGIWVAAGENPDNTESSVRHRVFNSWEGGPMATPSAPGSARSQVSALLEDRQGRVWLGMYWRGVYFQNEPGKWERVQTQGSLAQSVVTCFLEDRDGAIWAGTLGEGLHQILPKLVTMLMLPADAEEGIVNTAFAGDASHAWLGTDGKGVFQWDAGNYTRFGQAQGLPHEHVCAVLPDAKNNLWAGTWGGLVCLGKSCVVPLPEMPELKQPITALFRDRSGNLWAGGPAGLLKLEGGTNWTVFKSAHITDGADIRCITEDHAGNIWVATIGAGLMRALDGQLVAEGKRLGLTRDDVRSVLCDDEDVLWIGTLNGGLFRYAQGRLQHYSMLDGLPDDSIISLITDNIGNLWMSSDNGIFGCSRQRLAGYARGESDKLLCWRLTPANGLGNRGCSGSGQPVASRTADGKIWMADMGGVATFDPAMVTRGSFHPNVFVEFVTGNDAVLRPEKEGLRAPASTRRFEFHYTAPELAAPEALSFRYRLEPLDRDWLNAGPARVAAYSQLAPGTYQFRVMTGGADGQWHEAVEPVTLVVVPQFWQAAWFRLVALAAVIAAIVVGVRMNERRKLRRRVERMEAQQALETERRRIARDLHDDLGAGLTEVVLLGELSRQGNVPPGAMAEHVGAMTDKTRALVTAMNEIVWTVNPRNDSVKSLAAYLSAHMQRFLGPAGIRCRVSIPDDLPQKELSAQFRHNLFLALKEVLNNVAKHSGAKEVWFRVECTAEKLSLSVEDDGKGFSPGQVNEEGNGLENMRSRLEAIGGRASFTSEPGRGTKIVFTVPLAESAVLI